MLYCPSVTTGCPSVSVTANTRTEKYLVITVYNLIDSAVSKREIVTIALIFFFNSRLKDSVIY